MSKYQKRSIRKSDDVLEVVGVFLIGLILTSIDNLASHGRPNRFIPTELSCGRGERDRWGRGGGVHFRKLCSSPIIDLCVFYHIWLHKPT